MGAVAASAAQPARPALADPEIPPLENGDRLTRDEFERRYHAMPQVKKAELIGGSSTCRHRSDSANTRSRTSTSSGG